MDTTSHDRGSSPMSHQEIFALDLGTTKFCLATLHYPRPFEKPVIKKVVVPSGGMRRGMVCHMGEAQQALDALLGLAEKEFSCDVRQIYLGVAGSHLSSRIAEATLDLGGDTITSDDQRALGGKCARPHDLGSEILHNLPIHYRVDTREQVDCAIGFSGDFLTGSSFMIEADKNYLKDLIRLCNVCGLTVKKLYAEPLASASVVVPHELKHQGVVVVDIGGGTTDGIAFKGGKPIKLFTVNVGGEIMTQDLMTCLRISFEDAHQVKHTIGLSYLSSKPASPMTLKLRSGGSRVVTAEDVFKILSCRISELYQLIMAETVSFEEKFSSGMILTGGGSELAYISEYLSMKHSVYVTKNHPTLPKLANQTPSPDDRTTTTTPFATVSGLLYLAWLDEQKTIKVSGRASHHFKSLLGWFKEIA